MQDEQHGFCPSQKHILAAGRLVERITRNFDEKRLTGTLLINVTKAFDTVWIDGLQKLTLLKFPSYIVHTISYTGVRRPSRRPRHLVEGSRLWWLWVD
jgi:hypothetical protein